MNIPLIIGPRTDAAVAEVLEYAGRRVNWYRISPEGTPRQRPPGDIPAHWVNIPIGFRCVFSYTLLEATDVLYRHLTVSMVNGAIPHPNKVVAITRLFEFMDALEEWEIDIVDGVVEVMQECNAWPVAP